MSIKQIKSILEKQDIDENDKIEVLGLLSEMEKKDNGNNNEKSSSNGLIVEINNRLLKLEQKIHDSLPNQNREIPQEIKDKIEELSKKIPEKFRSIIPKEKPDLQLNWLENAVNTRVFEQGTDEIGSSITPTLPERMDEQIRPVTQKQILNMSDEEYEKLKSSGKLDYLLRNNLITE